MRHLSLLTLAQSVAAMCSAAPGRFALGIGTSSNVIVESWNGIPFEKPYQRVRDTFASCRAALAGEKVDEPSTRRSRSRASAWRMPVAEMPPLLVAALRRGCCGSPDARATARSSTGCRPTTSPRSCPTSATDKEIVARVFVLPTEDRDVVQTVGRRSIAAYLNVPVYAAFHEWLGRGERSRRCGTRGRRATARPRPRRSPRRSSTS